MCALQAAYGGGCALLQDEVVPVDGYELARRRRVIGVGKTALLVVFTAMGGR